MKILHPHFTVNPCGFPVLNLPTSTFRQEPLFTWFPLSDSWFLRISACSSHLSQASGKRSCENLSWRLKGITFSALGFECSYLYVWISESFGCHCKTPSEITWMLMQLSTYEILKPPFTHCTHSLSVLPGIQEYSRITALTMWNFLLKCLLPIFHVHLYLQTFFGLDCTHRQGPVSPLLIHAEPTSVIK